MKQPLFESDEMQARKVEEDWTAEDILRQEGIFYLKDLVETLKINGPKLKAQVRAIQMRGDSVWETMGVKRIWLHWIVRMKVFAPYYLAHLLPRDIGDASGFDTHTLLQQPGVFYLTDVVKHIPFTAQQLRYQAHKNRNARAEMGVWKDAECNAFLVDMPIFSHWLKNLWTRE